MGYLETVMRVLDAASALLSRLQELSVLAANDTNTAADLKAIDFEAEALGDEFHRLMSTSTYKGKNVFVTTAASEYVSLGGRDAEMTFGIGTIAYSNLYVHDYETYWSDQGLGTASDGADKEMLALADLKTRVVVDGAKYEVQTADDGTDYTARGSTIGLSASTDINTAASDPTGANRTAGDQFTAAGNATLTVAYVAKQEGQLRYTASEGLFQSTVNTDLLIDEVEAVQAKINTARVQAGSQYAALESAVSFTTDLTAQYELGFNTVNDVNFSMETAHLAKNQILQQAATAMLAQANQGQQGLLQLIQN
jgi:flagellin